MLILVIIVRLIGSLFLTLAAASGFVLFYTRGKQMSKKLGRRE